MSCCVHTQVAPVSGNYWKYSLYSRGPRETLGTVAKGKFPTRLKQYECRLHNSSPVFLLTELQLLPWYEIQIHKIWGFIALTVKVSVFEYVTTCSDTPAQMLFQLSRGLIHLQRTHFNCHMFWYTCTDAISVVMWSDTPTQSTFQLPHVLIHLHRCYFSCHVVWYTCTDGNSVATWSDTPAQTVIQLPRGLIHLHRR